jgi:hypothetical protein
MFMFPAMRGRALEPCARRYLADTLCGQRFKRADILMFMYFIGDYNGNKLRYAGKQQVGV